MAEFQCSCGEFLLASTTGILRCWFCSAEHDLNPHEVIKYEPQQSRPVIKSLEVSKVVPAKKKSDWI